MDKNTQKINDIDYSESCSVKKGFNYCFWAKLLVAIPALPLVATIAALQFTSPILQLIAATVAVVLAIIICMKIDRLPVFQGMVNPKKKNQKK